MMYNPFNLEGKTILVTGASSGIGKQTAIECSRLGASVIITGRDETRLQQTFDELATNEGHKQVIADLLNQEDVERLVSEVGSVDGVVLCAGKGLTLPVQFCTREKFDDIFNINFFSPIEVLRLLFKKKQINKEGSVVILASLGGTQIYSGGNSIYGA